VVVNKVAASLRAKGLDELPQLSLVRKGILSIWGPRPLLEEEDAKLRQSLQASNTGRELLVMHDDIVTPALPGMLSSFALYAHRLDDNEPEMRLRLNIHDALQACPSYDLGTLLKGGIELAKGELLNGHVGITSRPPMDS
jgi:hypothetical protein